MSGPISEANIKAQSLVLKGLGLEIEGRSLLQGVNLTLPGRGVTVIFGRSGTGKTTLLRALSQLTPFSGEIFLGDEPAASFKPEVLRRRLQYLHQEPSLFPGTVRHNLLLPFSFKKNPLPQPGLSALSENLQVLGLEEDILDQDALRLSGGEKQRVALVRSLLLEPSFLLLDEPTSAMDVSSEDLTLQVLRQLGKKTGVIMVSHSVQLITTADRALLLADGSLKEITENLDRASVQKLVEDG